MVESFGLPELGADGDGATPDRRYGRGVRAGTVAELFGLGLTGVRWPQVGVIVIGFWLSGSGISLFRLGFENLPAVNLVLTVLWPVTFVFSAITAIRSFQSTGMVAVSTGALFSLIYTSIRLVLSSQDLLPARDTSFWMQAAISSFVWPVLTMLAINFAAAGTMRWVRMACGLFAASVIEMYVNHAIYSELLSPVSPNLGPELPTMIGAALILTAAFWIGESRYGKQDDGTPRADDFARAPQMSR